MKIRVETVMPAPAADTLLAIIDMGAGRVLFNEAGANQHPAWADLERRKGQGNLDGAYLAVGAAPLYYQPAESAKFWDDEEKIRILAARAYNAACERQAANLVLLMDGPQGAAAAPLAAEGILLRAYKFNKYKSPDNCKKPAVHLIVPKEGLEETARYVGNKQAIAESVNRARDLINEPGSAMTPEGIEAAARKVAEHERVDIIVLQADDLKAQGYEGLIAVGKGAVVPPRMIVMSYEPKKPAKESVHLGLLGKGISFDTGGISLKPGDKMWEMKSDMSGAAAVIYAMEIIALANLPIKVTAIICTAHNAIDANSTLPGDVIRGKNGKTAHIDNTDAEGRLVLIDGLARMGEEKVTHLVDAATLTGACIRALGTALTGTFGNDDFADLVGEVAATQGEPCWRLPIVEEYIEMMKSDVADVNNIANKPYAGATIGAMFLREFLPEGIHWVHCDIAGTAFISGDWKYYRPGATGILVRTFAALADRLSK